MAATILEIVEGIETRLATISGLRVAEFAPDSINVPMAFASPPEIPDYRSTFKRGFFTIAPTVTVLTSAAYDRVGQRLLMEFLAPTGAKSIPAAIEGDMTLGGVVDSCVVQSFGGPGMLPVGAVGYYGGVFQLRVIAQGV